MNRFINVMKIVLVIAIIAAGFLFAVTMPNRAIGFIVPPEHGAVIGSTDDVPIYYHRYDSDERSPFGEKWQCVEFVNRWLVGHGHRNLQRTGNAVSYYTSAKAKGLTPHANGGAVRPERGDVIVFDVATHSFGHVGIVIRVEDDTVVVAQQNMTLTAWPLVKPMPVERFPLLHADGKWNVNARGPLTCLGWSRPSKRKE